jgi:protein-disulfide isomerase-like protein with CxxC motif
VSFALRDALFERGRNIGSRNVLSDIAEDHGIDVPDFDDRSSIDRDWHEGESRGVKGSPHFFHDGTDVFCPSLSITREVGHGVKIARDMERLHTFMDTCLSDG